LLARSLLEVVASIFGYVILHLADGAPDIVYPLLHLKSHLVPKTCPVHVLCPFAGVAMAAHFWI